MRFVVLALSIITLFFSTGCSSSSQTDRPSDIVVPEKWWGHYTLSVGQKLVVNSLKVTIEFKGVANGSIERNDTLPQNATVLLNIKRNDATREVEVKTNTEYADVCGLSCSCTGIADDLPSWVVCVSKLRNAKGVFTIRLNLNQSFRL